MKLKIQFYSPQFLLVMLSLLFIGCDKPDPEETPDLFEGIYLEYGVKVHSKYSPDFFPTEWREAPISAFGSQISPSDAEYMVGKIDEFLSRYNRDFISQHLTDIYLFKELIFFNKMYGGTYRHMSLYIPNNGYSHSLHHDIVMERLHHEFSSILYHSNIDDFPSEDWEKLIPEDFEYPGSGVEMLGEENLMIPTEELLQDGFLVKYSTSSMENDLNMLVSWMFNRHNELQELAENYPLIKAKYNLTVSFYEEIGTGAQIVN